MLQDNRLSDEKRGIRAKGCRLLHAIKIKLTAAELHRAVHVFRMERDFLFILFRRKRKNLCVPLRHDTKLRGLICLHDIEDKIIHNRIIILRHRRIHQVNDFAFDKHDPIGIVEPGTIARQRVRKTRKLLTHMNPKFFRDPMRIYDYIGDERCKLCVRESCLERIDTTLHCVRVFWKAEIIPIHRQHHKEHGTIRITRLLIHT